MAKISKHGGPTNKALVEPEAVATPREVLPVDETAAEVAPMRVLIDYDAMLRTQLQDLCRQRGVSPVGNKDELAARLVASDAVRDDPAPAAEETDAED